MDKFKDWIVMIISGLVLRPEDVRVEVIEDEQGVLFTIFVDQSDMGKIIGKRATIIEALRTVVRSAGYVQDIRASLKIDGMITSFPIN